MHFCIVATLCFFEKNISRNYYYCDQDDNSLGLCFKSMYLTLIVAIFTSNFIFSMFKSFHTCRNINISNLPLTIPGDLFLHEFTLCDIYTLDSEGLQHFFFQQHKTTFKIGSLCICKRRFEVCLN